MKKMKNDNKGFTLVELIVVLVILAILAAILVPALLGYIDEAKQKQIVLHGKSVYTAAQSVASKYYGKNTTPASASSGFATDVAKIADMNEFEGSPEAWVSFSGKDKHAGYVVYQVDYTENGTDWIWFDGKNWESGSGAKKNDPNAIQIKTAP